MFQYGTANIFMILISVGFRYAFEDYS